MRRYLLFGDANISNTTDEQTDNETFKHKTVKYFIQMIVLQVIFNSIMLIYNN